MAVYADALTDRYRGNPTPQASFAFEYDDRTETLTVSHRGGEGIEGRQLYVVANDRTIGNFSTYGTVDSGDSITVTGMTRADDVSVVWWNGIRYTVLARW